MTGFFTHWLCVHCTECWPGDSASCEILLAWRFFFNIKNIIGISKFWCVRIFIGGKIVVKMDTHVYVVNYAETWVNTYQLYDMIYLIGKLVSRWLFLWITCIFFNSLLLSIIYPYMHNTYFTSFWKAGLEIILIFMKMILENRFM